MLLQGMCNVEEENGNNFRGQDTTRLSGTVFLLLTHNNDKFEFYSQHFYKLSYNITNVEFFY